MIDFTPCEVKNAIKNRFLQYGDFAIKPILCNNPITYLLPRERVIYYGFFNGFDTLELRDETEQKSFYSFDNYCSMFTSIIKGEPNFFQGYQITFKQNLYSNPKPLTPFQATEYQDACVPYDFTEETFPVRLYHNGSSEYPQIGDKIFTDLEGTLPFTEKSFYASNEDGIKTDVNGISYAFVCR